MYTMNDARARFDERYLEFRNKARAFFRTYKPEAKEEAVANTLFLTWHYFSRLIKAGKADDRYLTSVFCYACRQTYSGRMLRAVRNDHSRELFAPIWKRGQTVLPGFDMDGFVNHRASVPDQVAFRIDTQNWFESLTENQRSRAQDLANGHSTKDCAKRWKVSRPAVSLYRRQLSRNFERFMIAKSKD